VQLSKIEKASEMQQPSCKSKSFGLVLLISKKLKNKCMHDGLEIFSYVIFSKNLPVGDGDDPGPQLLGHLICLFTLIINIYGLGVGISTIIKLTSGRGGA
jgi:hypothetical protein